jgi:hypothetical protein
MSQDLSLELSTLARFEEWGPDKNDLSVADIFNKTVKLHREERLCFAFIVIFNPVCNLNT